MVMDQPILFHEPNKKKVRSEKMDHPFLKPNIPKFCIPYVVSGEPGLV